jgi:putative ABC transport system permease protein
MNRPGKQDEIRDEIEFHIDETIDALIANGMSPADARREAARRYGNRRRHAAAMRAVNRPDIIGTMFEEVRFAIRALRRAPAYTMTAVLTLALVSGVNLTMFGIADGLTYRPLKYLKSPSQVHRVYWQWTNNGRVTTSASTQYTRVVDLIRDGSTFADVAAFAERTVPVGEGADVQQQVIAPVSASYWRFFNAGPALGRFFTPEEDVTPRGADVVVLGHRYWRTQFAGRNVLGQVLKIGDLRATIIGVAPEGFDGLNDGRPPVAFVPITSYAASTGTSDSKTYFSAYKWGWVHILVRRAPGVTVAAASMPRGSSRPRGRSSWRTTRACRPPTRRNRARFSLRSARALVQPPVPKQRRPRGC